MQRARTLLVFFQPVLTQLKTPLIANAYALMLSTIINAGLGMVFWTLAARVYDASVVGVSSAIIVNMTFLAGMAELNLTSAFIRFIPTTGRLTTRFILTAYGVTSVLSLILSGGFLLVQSILTPEQSYASFGLPFVLWFMLSTLLWCMYMLQDNALIGLRQAIWVLPRTIGFSVGKILLLLLLAGIAPDQGIFVSWTLIVFALMFPINWLIFKRLIPRDPRVHEPPSAEANGRVIARFVGPDYVGRLLQQAAIALMPLIVLNRLGEAQNAYFYMAWLIAYTPWLLTLSLSQSMTVEAAADPARLGIYTRRILVQMARLLMPLVVVLVLGAPLIMSVFGSAYAEQATGVFRILSVAAIFSSFNLVAVAIARVRRNMASIVMIEGTACIIAVVGSFALSDSLGLAGVGIAYLAGQVVVAALVSARLVLGALRSAPPAVEDTPLTPAPLATGD